jgi:hypothetical protein
VTGIVIHRSRHAQQYVVVPNAIARSTRLSFRARGLLVMLLSLPPDWHVTTDQLAEDNPEGRDVIRRAMAELRAARYVVVVTGRGAGGRIWSRIEVFDAPQPDATRPASGATCEDMVFPQVAPDAEKPATGKPASGNPAPYRSTGPKYGPEVPEVRGRRSVANSQKPRVHDGPDLPPSDDQQRSIPVTLQSQAADRNARTRGAP